jgi:hypothetical protein
VLFAYFGPETMLPLTSVIAAAGGFLLMFGRQTTRIAKVVFRSIAARLGGKARPTPDRTSHTRAGQRVDSPARSLYQPMAEAHDKVSS